MITAYIRILKAKRIQSWNLTSVSKRLRKKNNLTYIDLWQFLADKNGKLKNKYTNDGLHLTGPGYKAWTNGIRSYLDE